MVGNKYGKLTVLGFSHVGRNYMKYYHCICDCGTPKVVRGSHMTTGGTTSCGCVGLEKLVKLNTTHGLTSRNIPHSLKISSAWKDMIDRCSNPKFHAYHRYGGRGIKVCKRWANFPKFFDDMYEPMIKHIEEFGARQTTLDRVDNDKDYSLENCRWATVAEQMCNTSRVRLFEYKGKTNSIHGWATEFNIHPETVRHRLDKGVDIETALTTKPSPIRKFT